MLCGAKSYRIIMSLSVEVPMKIIGPFEVKYNDKIYTFQLPVATYETTLWPSMQRGSKVISMSQTTAFVEYNGMTRSFIVEAKSNIAAFDIKYKILSSIDKLDQQVERSSNYAKLLNCNIEIIANLLYIRCAFDTKDASGHNMSTKASDFIINYLLEEYELEYVSISGNYCVDKKASAVNGILGRGRRVSVESIIKQDVVKSVLKTTPKAIVDLNIKKNLIGSILAGSIRSANAHYANMLFAIYLSLGQDVANIVEGSQGITCANLNKDGDLVFSVNIPNVIVGIHGNGKHLKNVQDNLKNLKINDTNPINPDELAMFIGAGVFASELSLLASQTNKGDLMKSHTAFERK
jgi:hydroxymethylglutaryl-CoA reductase (NADPH)